MVDSYQTIKENIEKYYDAMAVSTCRELEQAIKNSLDSCGIIYRLFSRKKSKQSVLSKMEKKAETKYIPNNAKMQDIVGIRIVLYFNDDVDICIRAMRTLFGDEIDREHDHPNAETFKPQRINYVFRIPKGLYCISEEMSDKCHIDNTFEVQIRTIFSEGWHEVEHDMRYKYYEDWENEPDLARELNGLLAVLEVCDNNILAVCDRLAYHKYKNGEWESMIRNHFRIRLQSGKLSEDIEAVLNKDKSIGKAIYRFDRNELVHIFELTKLPKNYDNIIFLINESSINNPEVRELTPDVIRRRFSRTVGNNGLNLEP